ncbi:hypothetical protein J7K99_05790, partial [bacterium]|nr:hypothetical protein [bacterium]
FYREKILSRDDLRTITLPRSKGKVKVEQELHGWVVRIGRSTVECASKEEAEYVAMFAEIGVDEIVLPRNQHELAEILVRLKELKQYADNVLNTKLSGVVNPKTRRSLYSAVWKEILKE